MPDGREIKTKPSRRARGGLALVLLLVLVAFLLTLIRQSERPLRLLLVGRSTVEGRLLLQFQLTGKERAPLIVDQLYPIVESPALPVRQLPQLELKTKLTGREREFSVFFPTNCAVFRLRATVWTRPPNEFDQKLNSTWSAVSRADWHQLFAIMKNGWNASFVEPQMVFSDPVTNRPLSR